MLSEQKVTEFLARMDNWPAELDQKKALIDAYLASAHATELLPANSVLDPFYLADFESVVGVESYNGAGSGDKEVPTSGWVPAQASQSTVELVSPLWYGFNSVRSNVPNYQAINKTENKWLASPVTPFFGDYAATIRQGGFLGRYYDSVDGVWRNNIGWGGTKQEGRILKIDCPAVPAVAGNNIWLTMQSDDIPEVANKYLLRAWVYVKQGGIAFGNHFGHNGVMREPVLTAADCAEGVASQPFQLVEIAVDGLYGGHSLYREVSLTPMFGQVNEIYIAATYLCPLRGTKNIRG